MQFVVVHSPYGLFHFLHIFYKLDVWCIFLCGVQIFKMVKGISMPENIFLTIFDKSFKKK